MRGDDLGDESRMLSWTATHAKEKAIQRSRTLKRKIESMNAGELLPHEVSGNLRAAAAQQMIKNDDADKARMQKAARIEKRSAPCLISKEILAVGRRCFYTRRGPSNKAASQSVGV